MLVDARRDARTMLVLARLAGARGLGKLRGHDTVSIQTPYQEKHVLVHKEASARR